MQPRRRARRPYATDLSPNPSTPSRSAAWLAGERLFSAAPQAAPAPEAPVVVTIRRSKLAALPAASAEGAHEVQEGVDWKGPRVFRVEAASNEAEAESEASLADAPPAEPLPALPAPPVKRRQRIGVDRRPGPVVVQVFQVEPAAVPATPAEPPFAEQLRLLRAALAEVERLLSEAQRAQALRFLAG